MVRSFICPLAYSLLLGGVWSSAFGKRFSGSLAPAYMAHILVVLLSGLLFRSLTVGIYGGIGLAGAVAAILVSRGSKKLSLSRVSGFVRDLCGGGLYVFVVFFLFCYITNCGKRFLYWDELSHWGMFLKESLRLDRLYCESPLSFAHKDYVPAVTLFETIWCRLAGRYAESDVYRAIQVFMFSTLLPVLEPVVCFSRSFSGNFSGRRPEKRHAGREDAGSGIGGQCSSAREGGFAVSRAGTILLQLSAVVFLLLIPLVFNTSHAFLFYHSIYCDMCVGLIFFWCLFEACRDRENPAYLFLSMTIGTSVLVLSKMTSMALLPLVTVLLTVMVFGLSERRPGGLYWAGMALTLILPAGLWAWFNRFVDGFVANTGNRQSYDGMRLADLKDVFGQADSSAIPWVGQVRKIFADALLHRDILIRGSYAGIMLLLAAALLVLAGLTADRRQRRKTAVVGVWTLGAGIYYALLMNYLYATAFTEYEAVRLASYERYMNSFVIAVIYLLIGLVYESCSLTRYRKRLYILPLVLTLLLLDLAFFHRHAFDQILPGSLTDDEARMGGFTQSAAFIMDHVPQDENVYVIKRGDDGAFASFERYYCDPINIEGGSVGPAVSEEDVWSSDLTVEEFTETLSGFDYIYFKRTDAAFLEKYAAMFEDPPRVADECIYRLDPAGNGGKVKFRLLPCGE